jgi:hypothetical protein
MPTCTVSQLRDIGIGVPPRGRVGVHLQQVLEHAAVFDADAAEASMNPSRWRGCRSGGCSSVVSREP